MIIIIINETPGYKLKKGEKMDRKWREFRSKERERKSSFVAVLYAQDVQFLYDV